MNRAICWRLNLTVVSLTTAFLVAFQTQGFAQSVLPAPARDDFAPDAAYPGDPADTIEQPLPEPEPPSSAPAASAVPQADGYEPYLGLTLDPQSRDVAIAQSLSPGSPAALAGIEPGDTIEAINGRPVASSQDVLDLVDAMRPGDRLDIDYSRRIRVRTQAVLDGRPAQRSQTTRYAPNLQPAASRYDQRLQQAPEQLPPPASYSQPQPQNYRQYTPSAARRAYDISQAARRNEDDRADRADRARRAPERPRRLFDRGDRDRPLLPWRRN